MGDIGDYWREARDDRRRAKDRPRKYVCECGHSRSSHEGGGFCDGHDALGLPCLCERFVAEVDDER